MIRAILTLVREGAIKLFSATGRPDESFEDREYLQHYGFTSRPLSGAEGIIIRNGNHLVMIASDDRRYRIALDDGEVALYSDEGDKVHLKRNREIEVVGGNKVTVATQEAVVSASTKATVTSPEVDVVASTKVTIQTPEAEITGNLSVGGNVAVAGSAAVTGALASSTSVADSHGTIQSMRNTYNGHVQHIGGWTTSVPDQQM